MRSFHAWLEILVWLAVLSRFGTLAADDDDDMDIDDEDEDEPEKPKAKPARPKPEVEDTVIGIDLGTTFSCVAVMKKSGVEIIPNDQGNRITPSYVSFTEGGKLIGEAAKNEASLRPTQTMFDIKRLIGRRYGDETVKEDMKALPYKIVEDDSKLMVQAEISGESKNMMPEEISAMVLTKMKETAEAFLGQKVENAVITVPAYFSNSQREATRDAGKIAGLNVMRIINEPTAAALAYGLDKKDEANILVYDLGGGTFDVSLLTVAEGVIEVVSTNGDTHLGGEDFDNRLLKYLQEVFEEKSGQKIGGDKRAMSRLRQAAEKAKIALSSAKETKVDIESLANGVDLQETVNRAKFEELNNDLFKRTLLPVKQVLEDGKMKKDEVDEIVLVGGSTRIPKVQSLLKDFFNGKEPNLGLNPDEAVAYGAAVQGGILSGVGEDTVLLDITPISIGIETNGGLMDIVIARNSQIPVTKTKSYVTTMPDTKDTSINVYEGERPLIKHNNKLGGFILSGFPTPSKAGLGHTVTLDIDVNGIMTVSAKITASGEEKSMTIEKTAADRLTQDQIDSMIQAAEDNREQDAKDKERASTKASFDKYEAEMKKTKAETELPAEEDKVISDKIAALRKLMLDKDVENSDLKVSLDEYKKEIDDIIAQYPKKEKSSEASQEEDDDDDDPELAEEDPDLDTVSMDDQATPDDGSPAPAPQEGEL
jgi:heat shock protein 5